MSDWLTKEERERILAEAKVGLRALVDEATGYQEHRGPRDLRDYAEELGVEVPTCPDSLPEDAA